VEAGAQIELMPSDNSPPVTYFGLYSLAQRRRIATLLASLGVGFFFETIEETEQRLREWTAWDDATSDHPTEGHELWIYSSDLDKVGTHIVDMFPERKFGVP
jgi:hypothetical protein